MNEVKRIDEESVIKAYARWAPVYDLSFGPIADAGRKCAVDAINRRRGKVLEVGVGTGISLPRYAGHLRVTGIDLSPQMLKKARNRVAEKGLANIDGLFEMDAADLQFDDGAFDTVVAMYVMTVVPDPARVLAELERVCAPGGDVLIVNHFAKQDGMRAKVEKLMAPASRALGWHPDFPLEAITENTGLKLMERRPLKPFGLFTMLRLHKPANGAQAA